MLQGQKPKNIKYSNHKAVFSVLRQHVSMSIGDIAGEIHLSNTAVSKIVSALQERNMILSFGKRASTNEGGKRAELFSINKDYKYGMVLAAYADILECYIYDVCGNLRYTQACETKDFGYPQYVDRCAVMIEEVMQNTQIRPDMLFGCYVTTSGIIDSIEGVITYPVWSPAWGTHLPFIEDIKKRLPFELDMEFENNSRISGYAELQQPDGSEAPGNFASILSLYTQDDYYDKQGIGGSIVNQHVVRRGAHGFAGEFGHLIVDHNDEEVCLCGRRGCLQTLTSPIRLYKEICARREKYPDSVLWAIEKEHKVQLKDIFDASNRGDPLAVEVMDMAVEYNARAIEYIILTIDPEVIYIGGSYVNAGDYFLRRLSERVRHCGLFGVMNNLDIRYSKHNAYDAVHLGAAMYLLDRYLSRDETFSPTE